jgi:hypothetical protein
VIRAELVLPIIVIIIVPCIFRPELPHRFLQRHYAPDRFPWSGAAINGGSGSPKASRIAVIS